MAAMFSSALNKLTSNISSNYSIAPQPSASAGPWRIYDGKHRASKKLVSVFVFERKTLDPVAAGGGGGLAQSRGGGGASLRRAHDEVVERLRKEASSLARLRHPSILELAEPVEDTRSGGLMFATEPVIASLAGSLSDKDSQAPDGRRGTYSVAGAELGGIHGTQLEVDELEIQKGLLQVGKGLEFLHESAGLVHANLTPDAIFINAKSDWKISGLGFSTPPDQSTKATSVTPISLSEALNYDPRLPRAVQLNLDYASPDFVLDTTITTAADMFSLGLIIIAMYNSPRSSPINTGQSISTYRRTFSSPSSVPTVNNNFLISSTLPQDIKSEVLPRLITRRNANRYTAREFQQARYFDNILVSTIRFLDSLPAKTANEKSQFLRGLPRVLSQFPKSVLEKKVLPAMLEETKDLDLLALILQNVFKTLDLVTDGRRVFPERVIPHLRSVFLSNTKTKGAQERDTRKEGGLMVLIENMSAVTTNCSGKEFKDDILPILYHAFESPSASLVDRALSTLPLVLPIIDFSTIKNELFPIIAHVFSKTSSMAIKIRGLDSLCTLCGGTPTASADSHDDFISMAKPVGNPNSSAVLDKYTIQEKVVPLLKGIKTKEPAVMMAALDVFRQVGKVADADFLAFEVIPTLWVFSLGPLLNLEQFQSFMALTKSLSARIEQEQTRKLGELTTTSTRGHGTTGNSYNNGSSVNGSGGATDETDFEALVTGRTSGGMDAFDDGWVSNTSSPHPATLRTSSQANVWAAPSSNNNTAWPHNLSAVMQPTRTVTPDTTLSSFATLAPAPPSLASPPLQPTSNSTASWTVQQPIRPAQQPASQPINWSSAAASNPWSQPLSPSAQTPSLSFGATSQRQAQPSVPSIMKASPMAGAVMGGSGSMGQTLMPSASTGRSNSFNTTQNPQKQGMDKYDSLI